MVLYSQEVTSRRHGARQLRKVLSDVCLVLIAKPASPRILFVHSRVEQSGNYDSRPDRQLTLSLERFLPIMFPRVARALQRKDRRALLSEFADYALAQKECLKETWAERSLLEDGLRANGLMRQETVSDGNCGLHAILLNLLRLELQTEPASGILSLIEKKGLGAACMALRLNLLLWIRDHAAEELVPSVSISDWVEMEGYDNLSGYIQNMKQDKTWIDTIMLHAASAVFGLQIVIFLDNGKGHLLASQDVQKRNSAHVCLLGNTGNVHFFAAEPVPAENLAPSKTSSDMWAQQIQQAPLPGRSDDESDGSASDIEMPSVQQSHKENTFRLCTALLHWDPFGPASSSAEIAGLMKVLEGSHDQTEGITQTLQWRAALKLLQHEQREEAVDRSFHLELARINVLNQKAIAYEKSRALAAKLSLCAIKKGLAGPCQRHNSEHKCLHLFRRQPLLCLRWRKLWLSLPKVDREQRLIQHFANQQKEAEENEFKTQYTVFGQAVCRDAFIRITGIHADTLQRARTAAVAGMLHKPESAAWRLRRAPAYLDCRAWLLDYARLHADTSPLNTNLWLPYARKHFFWSAYVHD